MTPANAPGWGSGTAGSAAPANVSGTSEELVTVLFFAAAREAVRAGRVVLGLPVGTTVAEVVDVVRRRYGADLDAVLPSCAVWVNGAPAQAGTVVRGGDEVAVMPPVSGG